MKRRKHALIITMMTSSVMLLLVLQFIWLRLTYNDAKENFRRDTGILFRSTVLGMYDVLIEKSIESIRDTIQLTQPHSPYKSSKPLGSGSLLIDSITTYLQIEKQANDANLFIIGARKDTLSHMLAPKRRRVIIRDYHRSSIPNFKHDSLQVDSIVYHLKEGLKKQFSESYSDLKFAVNTVDAKACCPPERFENKRFIAEVVMLNPEKGYMIVFSGAGKLLLKAIAPQILFSIFLTFLTVAAFYIMYKSLRSQERLMQLKNAFISNVTHELKTPVATVSVALEALRNFNALNNPHKTQEYLEIAHQELNRLTLMTDKILKTTVFENNGIKLRIENIEFDLLIEQVLSSMKPVFEQRHVQLIYKKEGTEFISKGSETDLTNVFYNVVDNAIKYSKEGAVISIILHSNAEQIELAIIDNGIGIPKAYQKKIFEKFFRVPIGDIHNTKGYGLGLSFVASVIKSHRGTIHVKSEPGNGTNFTIVLPKT
ncbi:sensor histidine kinase [Chryseosolibacter indicus]|uniref:histidine kinase n=1 Tax=Chryseosolibacter indicus TaxID=2782351 RepID=A0ABS5VXK1_9BACT|nr:HAMP domain-containing sensor histidine kinase [Chryseosolibacter indicus]MBT1706056.1 HAMP domain-containing histidine kinase [Chryseosolibacter indicus]